MSKTKHIIIIDDDPIVLGVISEILSQQGHRTRSFNSPVDAMQYVLSDSDKVKMVISDNDMPGMQGIELLRQLRYELPALPLLLVSGRPPGSIDPDMPFLAKPFKIESLIRCVADIIAGKVVGPGTGQVAVEAA